MDEPTSGIFDCDTHCYETRDCLHAVHARGVARSVDLPGVDCPTVPRRSWPTGGWRCSTASRGSGSTCLPARLAQGDAQADGVGESRRDLRARADAPRVPGTRSRACELHRASRASSKRSCTRPAWRWRPSNTCDDTEALYANMHSFNRWFDETWGFDRDGTIYATALLSLRDLDGGAPSSTHVLDRGRARRAVPDRAGVRPLAGRPLLRSGLVARQRGRASVVAFHIMEYWYNDAIAPAWGHDPVPAPWHMSAWQWQNTYGERPIEDTLSALIFDNLFGRFPDLKVLVVGVRRRVGAALRAAHGQEPRHGPQRPVDRRARSPSARARSSVATSASRRTRRTTSPWIVERPRPRRLDRDGLRLPARRGAGRPGRLRKLLDRAPADDQHKIMRGNAEATVRRHGEPAPLTVDLHYPPDAETFRQHVQTFIDEHTAEASDVDRWRNRLYEHRLLGLTWPREYGGGGRSPRRPGRAGGGVRAGGACPPVRRTTTSASRWSATRCCAGAPRNSSADHLAADPLRRRTLVPGLLRTERRFRPRRAAHPGRRSTATSG